MRKGQFKKGNLLMEVLKEMSFETHNTLDKVLALDVRNFINELDNIVKEDGVEVAVNKGMELFDKLQDRISLGIMQNSKKYNRVMHKKTPKNAGGPYNPYVYKDAIEALL